MVEFVPAKPDAVRAIARNLRPVDVAEIAAVHGRDIDLALLLRMSVDMSADPLVALADGEPIAVLGCAPAGTLLAGFGVPWLLGTDGCDSHPRVFVAAGRRIVGQWHARHGLLLNRVSAANTASIRWLRAIGFEIHKATPYGVMRLPFHPFTMG